MVRYFCNAFILGIIVDILYLCCIGGCCSVCFQKTHLVRDCPERTEEEKAEYEKKRKERKEGKEGAMIGHTVENVYEGGVDDDYDTYEGEEENEEERENKWDKKLRKKKERREKRLRRL